MAGSVAQARPAEEAAAIVRKADHAIAIVTVRDAPMRATRCRGWDLPPKMRVNSDSTRASRRAADKHARMNKFERQSRHPADQQALRETIAGELSKIPTEVFEIGDAPPIAPKAPLT